jgi:hypothetical protein
MKNIHAATLAVCIAALGCFAVQAQTNTALGIDALANNTTGTDNTAIGNDALTANTTGPGNTAVGAQALALNTTGSYNMATGFDALQFNTTGSNNTAAGNWALFDNSTGGFNAATGTAALNFNTTGSQDTATGFEALVYNTTGDSNIGIGYRAGFNNTTGSNNIYIGSGGGASDSGAIYIGTPGTQTSFHAAGVYSDGISSGIPVFINNDGQLGTVNSSIRYKEDVHDMADASSALFRLRPVTYRYKQAYNDGSKPIDYGLIAEEVAEVYPDLVVRNADGQIQTVQYQKLTPMLLNEVQKQHRLLDRMGKTMEQQQATMAQQQQTIQLLKTQHSETVQVLEKRLAALEAAQPSARLESRVAMQ